MKTQILIVTLFATLPAALTGCGRREAQPMPVASPPATQHAADGQAHAANRIALTEAQIRASGITVEEAGPARVRETLVLYGTVAVNAERVREVTARYPGLVRTVTRRVGDAVRAGETLATVESNESLRTYPVTAPLSGVVIQRNINPGEYSGDRALFTVADLSTVWVELSIFPRDITRVHVGQTVRVKIPDSSSSADGRVVYVAAIGQAASQTLTARALLDNSDRRWAPGLYVSAEITLAEAHAAVAIRNDALQTLDGHPVVFVKSGEGFAPARVTLGRRDSGLTEIVSGLERGARYAAANSFILKAELAKGEAAHED